MKQPNYLLVLTSLGFVLFSPRLYAEDIWQVYELARQNDPTYSAAEAEYRAEQENKAIAVAPLLPQVSASASRSKNKYEITDTTRPSTAVGTTDTDTDTLALTLTQTIYRHDRWVALRQADASIARAEANFGTAKQDLIVRVTTRYVGVLAAEDNLTFARAEKEAIGQQLQQTQQRFRVGLSAITDVHEAQARYDQAVAAEITADNLLAVSLETLREITGKPIEKLVPLKQLSLYRPEPDSIEEWVKTALLQNLTLLSREKTMEIAREEVNRIRAGHYPTLDLVGERSNTDNSGTFTLNSEETTVSVQLNVPIYSGGLVNSQTRQAEQRYMQNKDLYEAERRLTERQARSAYLSVIANISQVLALQQTVTSSRTALEATQTGFEVGTRTLVDVLNSQRELYRAERDYARARYDYILESLKLRQAAGTLMEEHLQKANEWFK